MLRRRLRTSSTPTSSARSRTTRSERSLTTLDGIGPTTAARLVAELGDIASFRSAAAIAAYVGAVPGLRQSGKRQASRAGLTPHGNARLRAKLWMPTLTAVQ